MMNNKMFLLLMLWSSTVLKFTNCQTCQITVKDHLWHSQWYLGGQTVPYDMNVIPAWQSCANGTGVTVGVVDNGIQNHRDLKIVRSLNAGYNHKSSQSNQFQYVLRAFQWQKNWSENDGYRWYNQYKYENSLKHGTRVAGIIAAKKNGFGTIGIAFGADIADIRIASTSGFESFDATLLNHHSNTIDVYSCSFANFHTGTRTYRLLENQEQALRFGTTHGRHKLGSVYVFATGNSGGRNTDILRDSCAYDRLVTNRYVISVAGIQNNLEALPNGEACSAMMVAAFTAIPGSSHKVVTTDIRNGYTDNFNQNSAATPMVSGAIALALSVNPNLTYRDIMHLLVTTSRSEFPGFRKRHFTRNAAGLYVSSYFGFGLLNIGALVKESKSWRNVPNRISCEKYMKLKKPMQRESNVFQVQITACRATYMEHVEVSLKVNHKNAGQIKWVIVSPYGTKSTILPGRGLDPTKQMNLSVLTVQLWGENPNGYWRLEPYALFGKSLDNGVVESIKLEVNGYDCSGLNCLFPAKQEQGRWSQWSEWNQCNPNCGKGTKTRFRQCKRLSYNRYCIGNDYQTAPCFRRQCQIIEQTEQGRWWQWSEWNQCNVNCGQGTKSRFRQCKRLSYNRNCIGNDYQTAPCFRPQCQIIKQTEKICPSPKTLLSLCVEECETDATCFGFKCCNNGCGHTCVKPITDDTN